MSLTPEEQASRPLNCYADDGTDWVIAYDPADADEVWRTTVGESHIDIENGSWTLCDPANTLHVDLDDGRGSRVQTIREWIAECGRGFLCSENY